MDRCKCEGITKGFAKITVLKNSGGKILGATVVGPNAGSMISELSICIQVCGLSFDVSMMWALHSRHREDVLAVGRVGGYEPVAWHGRIRTVVLIRSLFRRSVQYVVDAFDLVVATCNPCACAPFFCKNPPGPTPLLLRARYLVSVLCLIVAPS